MPKSKVKTALKGALTFHSETGTEGGYWAFQDEQYINYEKVCPNGLHPGAEVFAVENRQRQGKVTQTWKADGRPLPDPSQEAKLEALIEELKSRGGDTEDYVLEYFERADQLDVYKAEDGEDITVEVKWIDGATEKRSVSSLLDQRWQYEGLHYLGNGDRLTIFEKADPSKIHWQGVIQLKQHKLFTETVHNMWIHADMEGWDREKWAKLFFEGYPAELIPKNVR